MRKPINGSAGLWTAPNSELAPPGALRQAKGVVIRRGGMIEKRRPQEQVAIGADIAGESFVTACQYDGYLLGAGGPGRMYKKAFPVTTPGAWTMISSSLAIDTFALDRAVEVNGCLYDGTFKYDNISSGTPYIMGIPRALDVQLTLVASGSLLASTNSVGYRVCFGNLDAKANLVIGPPSGRTVVTASAAQNVTVKTWIPTAIYSAANATSYFVQVYRTPVQTVASVDPGEEMQLVYQAYLTAADVANKYISFTDFTPDGLRGASGYFCPGQEGLANANYQPPKSTSLALFKTSVFFGSTTGKHRARLQLLGVSGNTLTISTAAGGITKSGGNGIATFTGSPDLTNIPTDGTAKISIIGSTSAANNGEFPITAVVAATSITYTNAAAVTEPGTASSRAFPSKLTIAGTNYYGSLNQATETPASQLFTIVTAGSASQNVRDTCASLLRVVNQQVSPTVYGYYESGPDDGAGKMLFEEVSIGGAQFTLGAGGTLLYNSFNPTIPVAATLNSQNDARVNRLFWAKPGQPEHVPLINYFDIGSGLKKILALLTLREALLVFKEDGLFRVTGDGTGNFSVSPFDPTLILATASPVFSLSTNRPVTSLQNKAYAFCTKGIAAISESSVNVISGPVANKLIPYIEATNTLTAAARLSASERDGILYVALASGSGAGVGQGLAYCLATGAWTESETWSFGGAFYRNLDTRAFMLGTNRFVGGDGCLYSILEYNMFRESVADLSDNAAWGTFTAGAPVPADKLAVNITAVNAGSKQLTVAPYLFGYGNEDGSATTAKDYTGAAFIAADGGIWKVTTDASPASNVSKVLTLAQIVGSTGVFGFSTGRTLMLVAIPATIEWLPFTSGDDTSNSRFTEASVMLDGVSTVSTCSVSAYTEATTSTLVASMTAANTPFPTGITTQTLVRVLIPTTMQNARRLSVSFSHSAVAEHMFVRGVAYQFEPMDGREVT